MPRGRLVLLSVLVVAALTAGCAPTGSVAETPPPSAPPASGTPTPTADATADRGPVRAFDGDCDLMLTAEQRESLLGPGTLSAQEWHRAENPDHILPVNADPFGTTGGLECTWFAADGADLPEGVTNVRTTVLPATVVPNEFVARYAVAYCEPSYDSSLCRLGRTVGENWIMSTVGWTVYEAPSELLGAAIDAVAANLPAATQPRPAALDDGVWSIPDCEQLAEAIGLQELIGPYLHGYWEGSEQPEEVLLAAAGAARSCPLFSDSERLDDASEFYILRPNVSPGLAWQWGQLRSDSAGVSTVVDVAGATDAFATDGTYGATVFATDGTNVVSLYADSDDLEVAAEILGRIIRELSR